MLDIMFYCNHELSFILHQILYNYLQYNNKKKKFKSHKVFIIKMLSLNLYIKLILLTKMFKIYFNQVVFEINTSLL